MKLVVVFFLGMFLLSCHKNEVNLIPAEYQGTWYQHYVYIDGGGGAYSQNYYNPISTFTFADNMIYEDRGELRTFKWHITDVQLIYPDSTYRVFTVWRKDGLKKGQTQKYYFNIDESGETMSAYQFGNESSYYQISYDKSH